MWAFRNILWMNLLMGFLDQYCMGYPHYFVSQVIDGLLRRKCMSKPHHFVSQNIDGFPTSILYGLTIIFGKKSNWLVSSINNNLWFVLNVL